MLQLCVTLFYFVHIISYIRGDLSMNNNINSSFPNFEEFVSSFGNNSENANSNLNNNSSFENDNSQTNPFSNIDVNTIMKIKQIMEKMNSNSNNPSSNLLLSLKPYLKPSRKQRVDQYIQLLNMSSLMKNFGPIGGEKMK